MVNIHERLKGDEIKYLLVLGCGCSVSAVNISEHIFVHPGSAFHIAFIHVAI